MFTITQATNCSILFLTALQHSLAYLYGNSQTVAVARGDSAHEGAKGAGKRVHPRGVQNDTRVTWCVSSVPSTHFF